MSIAKKPVVVVVGSLHYDIMIDAPDRPRKGETVTGYAWRPKFGGKGGNQAVAAAKAGAETRMAGAVGDDDFGRFLRQGLETSGVDASWVGTVAGGGSGMSVAIADAGGDYGAVIVSGANLLADIACLQDDALWRYADVLLLQNEMPEPVNIAAARAARAAGLTVCLNAAPFRRLSEDFKALIDIVVVNAIEAEELSDITVDDLASAARAAACLCDMFPTVVVTAGGDGVAGVQRGKEAVTLTALPVRLVSTHGAGDVFMGALAATIASGKPFRACLASANEAAAVHVSTPAS